MGGNPRDHVKDKGFWDGGGKAHGVDDQSAGRPSGFPGTRKQKRVGIRVDLEFPPKEPEKKIQQRQSDFARES